MSGSGFGNVGRAGRGSVRLWAAAVFVVAVSVVVGSAPATAIITAADGGGTGGTVGCMNTSSGSMSASPASPLQGQPVLLSWSGAVASDCWSTVMIGSDGMNQTVPSTGSMWVTPGNWGPFSWTLRVTSPNGSATLATAAVSVQPLPQRPAFGATRSSDGRLMVVKSDGFLVSMASQTAAGGGFAPFGLTWPPAKRSVVAETNADGRVEMIALDPAGNVFQNAQTTANGNWSSTWTQIDGVLASASLARGTDGRLALFGSNQAGQVFGRTQVSAGSADWTGWQWFDAPAMAQVVVEANADGRLEMFGRDNAGAVYHRWQTAGNGAWSGWATLPGANLTSMAAARNSDGRIELVGLDGSGAVRDIAQTGGSASTSWTAWSSQPYGNGSQIAMETNADGRIEIIANDQNGQLAHRAQTSPGAATWTDWVPLTDTTVRLIPQPAESVAEARNGDGRMALFQVNLAGKLYQRVRTGADANSPWGGWTEIDASGLPSCCSFRAVTAQTDGDGYMEVFVLNAFGTVYHRWQTSPGSSTWVPWSRVDGPAGTGFVSIASTRKGNGLVLLSAVTPEHTTYVSDQGQSIHAHPGRYLGKIDGWADVPPAIVTVSAQTNVNGLVELFGLDPAGHVFHRWPSPGWTLWTALPGQLTSLAVARNDDVDDGQLEVFGGAANGTVQHRLQTSASDRGNTWADWSTLDGTLRLVTVATNSDGRVELSGVNTAGALVHRWQVDPAPSSAWTAWSNLDVAPGG
jgi:hypothetical protein